MEMEKVWTIAWMYTCALDDWDRVATAPGLHGIRSPQGRIQEFILGGGGANQGPQSKIKGEARIEGAKRPRIEGEAREKTGEGSGEGAR